MSRLITPLETPVADALVVHGSAVTPEGMPGPVAALRVDTAVDAWRNGIAPHIIVSGNRSFTIPESKAPKVSEASAMQQYGVDQGVPASAFRIEDRSLDTVGNALFVKDMALAYGWTNLTPVTTAGHLPRTLRVYNHVFGDGFNINGLAAPEVPGTKVNLPSKIWEFAGSILVTEILRGTERGDHEAIRERLFDLVPGYGSATYLRLLKKVAAGLLKV